MAYCGTFPGMCGKKPDCADTHRPGRQEGRQDLALAMALEIADEACRVDIECNALLAHKHPAPVYDVRTLAPERIGAADPELAAADHETIARAVRYLDLRGLLVRPIAGQPHLVGFLDAPEAL